MSVIIVALDVHSKIKALNLASMLDPNLCKVKVGMELFTKEGPSIVEDLNKLGFKVFLDLKFHDIPNTVVGAVRSACDLGVWMMNVHCLGGRKMLDAAVNEVNKFNYKPKLIGVTILTSMEVSDLHEIGFRDTAFVSDEVYILSRLAKESGLDGLVCSGKEVNQLRFQNAEPFILVTPGIRLPEGSKDDQARIVTPEQAIKDGASYIVVGRPITEAIDPVIALNTFIDRINNGC